MNDHRRRDDAATTARPTTSAQSRRRRVSVLASHVVGVAPGIFQRNFTLLSDDDDDDEEEEEEIQSAEEWISSVGKVFANEKRRYEVTQDSVDAFASVTRDQQWIHGANAAEEAAKKKKKEEYLPALPIAHGFFTVSLLTFLHGAPRKSEKWCKFELNVGMNRVRFRKPVEVGSVLGCRTRVKSVVWKRGREMLETTYECEVFKEAGGGRNEREIVLEAEWIVRQVLAEQQK